MGLHAVALRDGGMLVPAVEPIEQDPPAPPQRRMAPMRPQSPVATTPPVAAPIGAPRAATVELFVAPDAVDLSGAPLPRDEKIRVLDELNRTQVSSCRKCRLCEGRTHVVFGEGDVDARLMFIGEGPGENEDLTGRPFVGRAGQKLDEMIAAMGLQREQVFIANVVKCRPPGNRAPAPDEIDACTPYLLKQIQTIRPKVIVTLGAPATHYMLKTKEAMGRLRGRWHEWRGIKLMPTFHPAYILRNYTRETRQAVWSDLQKVMAELGLESRATKR